MEYKELDINQREELKIKIYNLREQKLCYSKITEELEKQDINISDSTVRKLCKKIYSSKGKEEPVIEIDRIELDYELIYNLREKGLTYKEISQELKKQGIYISSTTVGIKCKEIYYAKGKKEPQINRRTHEVEEKENKHKGRDIRLINERNQRIFSLRNQGWSYQKIANKEEISVSSVLRAYKKIENSRGAQIQTTRRHNNTSEESKELDELIYNLREQGLKYKEILNEVKESSEISTKQGVAQRYKKVFRHKEEQLAKAILNLALTRKATIEQIKQIADYYGVNIEKTLNSLEER